MRINVQCRKFTETNHPGSGNSNLRNIQNYFKNVKYYMFAYLECLSGGTDLHKLLKTYKMIIKSHRIITEHQKSSPNLLFMIIFAVKCFISLFV